MDDWLSNFFDEVGSSVSEEAPNFAAAAAAENAMGDDSLGWLGNGAGADTISQLRQQLDGPQPDASFGVLGPTGPRKPSLLRALADRAGLQRGRDGDIDFTNPRSLDAMIKLITGGGGAIGQLLKARSGQPQGYRSPAQMKAELLGQYNTFTPQQQASADAYFNRRGPVGMQRPMIAASQLPNPIVPGRGYAHGGGVPQNVLAELRQLLHEGRPAAMSPRGGYAVGGPVAADPNAAFRAQAMAGAQSTASNAQQQQATQQAQMAQQNAAARNQALGRAPLAPARMSPAAQQRQLEAWQASNQQASYAGTGLAPNIQAQAQAGNPVAQQAYAADQARMQQMAAQNQASTTLQTGMARNTTAAPATRVDKAFAPGTEPTYNTPNYGVNSGVTTQGQGPAPGATGSPYAPTMTQRANNGATPGATYGTQSPLAAAAGQPAPGLMSNGFSPGMQGPNPSTTPQQPAPGMMSDNSTATIMGAPRAAPGMAEGGALSAVAGLLEGREGGQDDVIPINAAGGEYIFDADTVAALGDGNNAAGAAKLDALRLNIRKHKRSAPPDKIPPRAKPISAYMPKGG